MTFRATSELPHLVKGSIACGKLVVENSDHMLSQTLSAGVLGVVWKACNHVTLRKSRLKGTPKEYLGKDKSCTPEVSSMSALGEASEQPD